MPQETCGRCRPCLRGDYHICDLLKVSGFQAPGCAQEFFAVPAGMLCLLPEAFTFEQGALVEPAAVAVHAVRRVQGGLAGKNVVVVGAGPIGNLVGQVARGQGGHVLISDLSEHRLDVARQCGLARTNLAGSEALGDAARRAFGGDGFDVAFECVGAEAAITPAIEAIQKGGTIVVVGVFGDRPRVNLGLVQDRELTIRGTLMYQREDYRLAIEGIAGGAIITNPLVSRHFRLDEFAAAYRFIDAARDKTVKVMIDV